MAIAFDATGAGFGSGSPSGTQFTYNHTLGSSATIIFISTAVGNIPDIVSSVLVGSTNCTFISTVAAGATGGAGTLDLWYLTSPPTGTQTITINTSSTPSLYVIANSVSYTGSATSSALDVNNTAANTSNSPSVSVTTTGNNEWIYGAEMNGNNRSISSRSGWAANRYNMGLFSNERFDGDDASQASAGSFTGGWTLSASGTWAAHAVAFNPAPTLPPLPAVWGRRQVENDAAINYIPVTV